MRQRRRCSSRRMFGCIVGVAVCHCCLILCYFTRRKPVASVAAKDDSFESVKCAFMTLLMARSESTAYTAFVESAIRLSQAFALERRYPHLVFYEGNFRHQGAISSRVPWARFLNISQAWGTAKQQKRENTERSLGYNHMCRFFAMQVWNAVGDVDLLMRVDDDIFFLKPVGYDPFRLMWRRKKAVYAFGVLNKEEHAVTADTLKPWLADRCKRIDAGNEFCEATASGVVEQMYFNNLFAARRDWWVSQATSAFMKEIDESGGIYRHRWGDAPIQTAAVRFLIDGRNISEQVFRFPGLHYVHFSTDNLIVDGHLQCLSCAAGTSYFRAPSAIQHPSLQLPVDALVETHRPAFEKDIHRLFNVTIASVQKLSLYVLSKVAEELGIWCDGAGRIKVLELLPRTCCCHLGTPSNDPMPDSLVASVKRLLHRPEDDLRIRDDDPAAQILCPAVRQRRDTLYARCLGTASNGGDQRGCGRGDTTSAINRRPSLHSDAEALRRFQQSWAKASIPIFNGRVK